jgi:hypothetical protein
MLIARRRTVDEDVFAHVHSSDVERASDWRYLAEGACSVVVRHAQSGAVLRVPKSDGAPRRVATAPPLHTADAFLDLLVAHLRPGQYAVARRHVQLSHAFCVALDAAIHSARPRTRQHRRLDAAHGSSCATLLPDMTCVPNGVADVLCVELKPKWCFVPAADAVDHPLKARVCRFCMHQRLKLADGDIDRISDFCPLDLASSDARRVHRALAALLRTPQNNLRLFFNGAPLGAVDEQVAQKLVDDADGESLLPSVASAVRAVCGSECEPRAALLEVVADALLESEVLSHIRQVQLLGGGDVSALKRRRDDAALLDEFLTSAVLKDCSVMLSLCRDKGGGELPESFVALASGRGVAVRVAIVDLEQKSAGNVDKYCELDERIVRHCEKLEEMKEKRCEM